MRKFLCLVFMLMCIQIPLHTNAMTIEYDGQQHEYTGLLCSLKVDGKIIDTPLMPPVIINDRTLVPVRELCEALGATVSYTDKNLVITRNNDVLTMTVDKNETRFNGVPGNIPDGLTPKLMNLPTMPAKTMVPARYIAEILGKTVDFDALSDTVLIYSKSTGNGPVTINNASFDFKSQQEITLTLKATGDFPADVSSFVLTEPTRIVFDIPNTYLDLVRTNIPVSCSPITAIRFGFENTTSRVVLDVTGNVVSYGAQRIGNTVVISAVTSYPGTTTSTPDTSQNSSTVTPAPVPDASGVQVPTSGPVIVPDTYDHILKKYIVIDAGHGGDDPGATSNVLGYTLNEKDLTLKIATKVRDILSASGYAVIMTRENDNYPTLTQRAEAANRAGAAIFVSIHMNSAVAESASGTETFYSEINNTAYFGATSSVLAKNIQDRLYKALSSRDRGVKTANHAVTRNSLMPAALIEVGFISNTQQAGLLTSDEYQNLAANAIAEGIIATWNDVVIPNDWSSIAAERIEALK